MGGCTMDYGCCNGGMKPFWGGFLGGFLGSVLNYCGFGFGGGGGGGLTGPASAVSPYGPNPATTPTGNEVESLQKLLGKDYTVSFINGEYAVRGKDGEILTGKTPQDIIDQINGGDTDPTTRSGDGDKTLKDKAQLQEECDIFNGKYKGKGTLEIITDPNDPNFGEYKLTYKDKDGNEKIETVKTIIDAQKLLGAGTVDDGAGKKDKVDDGDGGAAGAKGKGAADDGSGDGAGELGEGVSPEADFAKLLNKSKFSDWSFDPQKGLTINGKTYKTPEEAYKGLTEFETVSSEGFNLSSLNNINVDVIDHDDNVGDIMGKKATVADNTMTINGHTYQVVANGPDADHVYLKDTNPTRQGAGNQVYILEKDSDGKFRLSQYDYTANTEGYGIAAHPGFETDA